MNLPDLDSQLPTLLTDPVIVGHAQKADLVWTKGEFQTLCNHMLNGNPQDRIMVPFRDATGSARFVKAKKARASRQAGWAYDTITGCSKKRASIGFYPGNESAESHWAAMDFDAHEGENDRARDLALKAFMWLLRHPQLFIVLCTSGSAGWHLFVFTHEFHRVDEWTLMLKKLAAFLGVSIRQGECEIFPRETRGKIGYGIRAPGVWNPKYDTFSLIVYENVRPLIARLRSPEGKESINLFTARSNTGVKGRNLTYGRQSECYRGERDGWQKQFGIIAPRSRHLRLTELVGCAYWQVAREVGRANARMQYEEASPRPQTSLADHLKEYDDLWQGMEADWLRRLRKEEQEAFDSLSQTNEREAFRIIRNFAQNTEDGHFYIHAESLARRLSVTTQTACNIRQRFCRAGILQQTAGHVAHKWAARFRWLIGAPWIRDAPG